MSAVDRIESCYLHAVDWLFARIPQPVPSKERLKKITIFSHRGEHDNVSTIENTLPAFEKAAAAGVGGLECDLRWTKDLIPVVYHDADLKRLYNVTRRVADYSMVELKREFPTIPTLEEVIANFGKDHQLMIELKLEHFPDPEQQSLHLARVLKPLTPVTDFHLISLHPNIFQLFRSFPTRVYLPIARINAYPWSLRSSNRCWGGLTGHYTIITRGMINRHHRALQKVGTGFIHSRLSLFREVNRGVDWVFSNQAAALQKLVNDLLACDKLGIK